MDWTDMIYDQKAIGVVYALCPRCGSPAVDAHHECDNCEVNIAEEWLGNMYVCPRCRNYILERVGDMVDELAKAEKMDHFTAKSWFLAWSEFNDL